MTTHTSNASKVFSGIKSNTIITIVMFVLQMLNFSVFSRILTKTDFGYAAALSAVVSVFACISEAGIGSAIIQKKNADNNFISTAFTLSFLIGLFFAIIVFCLAKPLAMLVSDETIVFALQLTSITLLLNSLISVGNGLMMRKLQFLKYGYVQISSFIIAQGIGIYLALEGWGFYSIVIAGILSSALTVLLIYLLFVKLPRFKIYKENIKNIVSFGGWLTAGVFFNNLNQQIDKLVLSKWMTVTDLGSYSRPSGFVIKTGTQMNSIFDNTLFPILSSIQDDKTKVSNAYYKSISLLNIVSSMLAILFICNAHLIIKVFFGDEWLNLVPVLQIVSISLIFNIDGRLVDCFFRSLNYVKLNFYLRVICFVIMFVALFVGTRFGLIGTAIGVTVANILAILIKLVFLSDKVNTSFLNTLKAIAKSWKPMLIIVIMSIPFFFIEKTWLSCIIYAVYFSLISIGLFGFFPKLVGDEYEESVYPEVVKIKDKIFSRLK